MLYFKGKLCRYISGKLEHKLQAAVPVLYWYFFNLNEKMIVKKRKISSFLIAKIYDINFYQQILARILTTEQSIKSFSFIFLGFCFYFKSTFTIKKFLKDFWNDFSRTPHDGCFCWYVLCRN